MIRPRCVWFLVVLIATLQSTIVSAKTAQLSQDFAYMCGKSKTPLTYSKHGKALTWLVQVTGEGSLLLDDAPQHKAACWMLYDDPLHLKFGAHFKQRYALAVFYHATLGTSAWDVKTFWMSKQHECNWYGISCERPFWNPFKRVVTSIDISFNEVGGLLPRELSILSELQEIDLHGNDLQGVLPHKMLVNLKKLKYLRLHMNGFFGSLHSELGQMKNLRELMVFGNYFGGSIPKELGNLKKLEVIDVYANVLEGTIPTELAKIPRLRELDVHDNFVLGKMPEEICQRKLDLLVSDCLGRTPEVQCSNCCTVCCQGLPDPKCIDMKTGKEVTRL